MATPPVPVLNLDELAVRSYHVLVDGKPYWLRNPGELSIDQSRRLAIQQTRHDAISTRELHEISDQEAKELVGLLDQMCRAILDAPDDVHDRLTDAQRKAVIMTFVALSALSNLPAPRAETTAAATDPSIGETWPADSVATTEAPRVSG